MNAICKNCKWFASGVGAVGFDGECGRYPPRLFVTDNGESVNSLWPDVKKDHWCGEWQTDDIRRQ